MQWVLGSQLIVVHDHMHEIIWQGVGYLNADVPRRFHHYTDHPVFIDEPLVVLALSSLFQVSVWTERQAWIINSFCTSRNAPAFGFIFEVALMLVLMGNLGGKFAALSDIFHFHNSSPLGSKKVTLVALQRTVNRDMQCCQVSWNSGPSDRFGLKAQSPDDVLQFLNNPNGRAFLFPDSHMGPDVILFVQDEATKELILLAVQVESKQVHACLGRCCSLFGNNASDRS
jgi:hypothetical protein